MALTYIAAQRVFDRIDEAHKAYWGSRPGHPLSALDRLAREYQFGQSIKDPTRGGPVPTRFAYDDEVPAGQYSTPRNWQWFWDEKAALYDPLTDKPYIRTDHPGFKSDIVRINKEQEAKEGKHGGRIAVHELRHKAMRILRDNPGIWKDVTYRHEGKDKKLMDFLMPKGRWSENAAHDIIYSFSPHKDLKRMVGRRIEIDWSDLSGRERDKAVKEAQATWYTKEKHLEASSAARAANEASSLIPMGKWDYLESIIDFTPGKEDRLSEEQLKKSKTWT